MLVLDDGTRRVHALALGSQRTNCFIVESESLCFVIDPVDDAELIGDYLRDNDLVPAFAIATHAHFDHIGAAAGLIADGSFDRLYVHADDANEIERCQTYSMLIARKPLDLPASEHIHWFSPALTERLADAGFGLKHLPSHTPGSSILYSLDGKLVFTGDIIINNLLSKLRTAKGEEPDGMRAAFDFIESFFSPRTRIFPGHGKLTLMEVELAYNPRIRRLREVGA